MLNLTNTHTDSAGRERGREQGWRPVDEHRMGTGTGAGIKTTTVTEMGTGTGVETPGRIQDGDGDGSGDGNESNSGDGTGDDDSGNGNEDMIGEGGREAKKRKESRKTCRRHVGNGGNLGGKREKRRNKVLVQKLSTQII